MVVNEDCDARRIAIAGKLLLGGLLVTLEEGPAGGAKTKRLRVFMSVADVGNPDEISTTARTQTRATQGKRKIPSGNTIPPVH